jgi:hypothetical protein
MQLQLRCMLQPLQCHCKLPPQASGPHCVACVTIMSGLY